MRTNVLDDSAGQRVYGFGHVRSRLSLEKRKARFRGLAFRERTGVLRDVRADLPLALPDSTLVARVLDAGQDGGLGGGEALLGGGVRKGDGDGHCVSLDFSGGLIMYPEIYANQLPKPSP